VGLAAYARWIEPHWLEIVRRALPIRNLPSALEGATLAQLSDLHVGRQVSSAYLIDSFGRVADLRPEIVVITGDFVSWHDGVIAQLSQVMQHAPKGRLATLAVLGNHDYGGSWSEPQVAQRIVDTVAQHGVRVLRNETHEVNGLQLVGLDDLWSTHFDPTQVLPQLDPHRAALVLSHNPDTVDLPVWGRYDDWILSGHTHGGQCRPPFLPPPILPVENRRYTAGEFDLSGGRRLYINRGLGYLRKVRFNVRPEVMLFELTRA